MEISWNFVNQKKWESCTHMFIIIVYSLKTGEITVVPKHFDLLAMFVFWPVLHGGHCVFQIWSTYLNKNDFARLKMICLILSQINGQNVLERMCKVMINVPQKRVKLKYPYWNHSFVLSDHLQKRSGTLTILFPIFLLRNVSYRFIRILNFNLPPKTTEY